MGHSCSTLSEPSKNEVTFPVASNRPHLHSEIVMQEQKVGLSRLFYNAIYHHWRTKNGIRGFRESKKDPYPRVKSSNQCELYSHLTDSLELRSSSLSVDQINALCQAEIKGPRAESYIPFLGARCCRSVLFGFPKPEFHPHFIHQLAVYIGQQNADIDLRDWNLAFSQIDYAKDDRYGLEIELYRKIRSMPYCPRVTEDAIVNLAMCLSNTRFPIIDSDTYGTRFKVGLNEKIRREELKADLYRIVLTTMPHTDAFNNLAVCLGKGVEILEQDLKGTQFEGQPPNQVNRLALQQALLQKAIELHPYNEVAISNLKTLSNSIRSHKESTEQKEPYKDTRIKKYR